MRPLRMERSWWVVSAVVSLPICPGQGLLKVAEDGGHLAKVAGQGQVEQTLTRLLRMERSWVVVGGVVVKVAGQDHAALVLA
jgi:hypothetical protein